MSGDSPQPSSWRDVYQLVRDSHADVMVAVGNVDTKVTDLQNRVGTIEDGRRDEHVARETEARLAAARNRRLLTMIAASKGFIAMVVSIVAVIISVITK